MLLAYYVLLIIVIVIFSSVSLAILWYLTDADFTVFRTIVSVGFVFIAVIAVIGLIGSSETGTIYRTEYDKLIQNIDKNKTRVIKENDEITDIYITVNGEEHHFKIKEETTGE